MSYPGQPYGPDPNGQPNPYEAQHNPYGAAGQPYGAHQTPYPGSYPPGGPPGPYGGYPRQGTNGLAIASLICSILGFLSCCFFALAAAGVIMGHIALGQIARQGGEGRGMAMAGVIIGYAALVVGVLYYVLSVFTYLADYR